MIFNGITGERLNKNLNHWLLTVLESNPGMLVLFYQRDKQPANQMVAWYGEFPGKYLQSAATAYKIFQDKNLLRTGNEVVSGLGQVQGNDGYLGPAPLSERFIGDCKDGPLWDVWGHYHCMLGLYYWYKETGNKEAFRICMKAADCICDYFIKGNIDILKARAGEMNLSVIHIFCILYQETQKDTYLNFVRYIEGKWTAPGEGDYFNAGLAGIPFYKTNKPRWESLCAIQALGELYKITLEEPYLAALTNLWESIRQYDRHNTGGFSSGEQAQGSPYHPGAIETCCTVAWSVLTLDVLNLTHRSIAADELELSFYNGILGAQSPSGRWWTYNTPMRGEKIASAQDIVFQARAGSPELNCCSLNGPRGLSLVAEWAAIKGNDGIFLNYYGDSELDVSTPDGGLMKIRQTTCYPLDGNIKIQITGAKCPIYLRIPVWSKTTKIVNGSSILHPDPGQYEKIIFQTDEIELELDIAFHYWTGKENEKGKISIYKGPLLLAFDQRFNEFDINQIPEIISAELTTADTMDSLYPQPLMAYTARTSDGEIKLIDFITAGHGGTKYTTWIPAGFDTTEMPEFSLNMI